jgi:hypothetical protein
MARAYDKRRKNEKNNCKYFGCPAAHGPFGLRSSGKDDRSEIDKRAIRDDRHLLEGAKGGKL